MLAFVDDRKQLKIFVSPKAKKVIEDFAEQFDMKEMGVASRIYSWFGGLPLPIQKWITGLSDGDESEGLRQFAEMLVRGKRTKPFPSTFDPPALPVPDAKPALPLGQTAGARGGGKSK